MKVEWSAYTRDKSAHGGTLAPSPSEALNPETVKHFISTLLSAWRQLDALKKPVSSLVKMDLEKVRHVRV